ncbi:mechanosensitive ion channel family protein [Lacihabitans sp. LS3-19]|uniref:mechanosensitive ion channel family protein n=1 Tax=Lacihabitans sp. LS3-19 TaxID=2487335 RepID=UPI0020CF7FF1|nr:mechanosensitive ion channel domain-containing protein [Lacihabitans sp. LS3-19]MCP9769565.1 mechanosensitive ion channel family protein [Lacihabitans sp. LS3-19]
MPNLEKYLQNILDNIIAYTPKLAGAIAILLIGFWVANKLERVVVERLKRSQLSPEITSFIGSMFGITLKIAVLLVAAGIAGFDTSALVGMLAAAGFAVGLALQGGLANFASGILILIFKPYKVSDWIDLDGKFGKVEEIQIFNTILTTPGLKTLIIPNGQVTSNIVTNYSKKGILRLELMINMPYEESFPKVKAIIEKAIEQSVYIKKQYEPLVGIEVFDAHYIQIGVKPYVNPDEYWEAFYEINALLKKAFSENNIQVAYPDTVMIGKIGD